MLSTPKRICDRVLYLLSEGKSTSQVADIVGLNQSTIVKICQKNTDNDTFSNSKLNLGRARILSQREERNVVRLVASGICSTAADAKRHLNETYKIDVSDSTVRRVLKRNALHARIKIKKPLLRKIHRSSRYLFSKKHKNWTVEDWRKVVWSDESKFTLFGSEGRQYYWKKPGQSIQDHHIKPTVKHGGGSIMVWGCITSKGAGNLYRIDTNIDAKLYKVILEEALVGSLVRYNLEKSDIIFQHDNDPKHTAHSTKTWLSENEFNVLQWPSHSPDLNPIEHIWSKVDRQLRKYPSRPSSKGELWERLEFIWANMDMELIDKLYDSMPKRVDAVYKAKGGYTLY